MFHAKPIINSDFWYNVYIYQRTQFFKFKFTVSKYYFYWHMKRNNLRGSTCRLKKQSNLHSLERTSVIVLWVGGQRSSTTYANDLQKLKKKYTKVVGSLLRIFNTFMRKPNQPNLKFRHSLFFSVGLKYMVSIILFFCSLGVTF